MGSSRKKICSKCGVEHPLSGYHILYGDTRRPDCKTCRNAQQRRYSKKTREKWRAYSKDYYRKNQKRLLKYRSDNQHSYTKRNRERYQSEPEYRLASLLRVRMRKALLAQNATKNKGTMEYLGCTIAEFHAHIESKFTDGMCWDRISEIHLDHIRPCSSFDLNDPAQIAECFHHENIQPLWAADNLAKGATNPNPETTNPKREDPISETD